MGVCLWRCLPRGLAGDNLLNDLLEIAEANHLEEFLEDALKIKDCNGWISLEPDVLNLDGVHSGPRQAM